MLEAHLITAQDEMPLNVPHLHVGLTNRKYPIVVASVLVEKASNPVMTISVYGNDDDYFFKQSVLLWNTYIVIGVGHQVTFVHLANHASTTTDLGCYFGYLYPADGLLLIASARYLHCFGSDGNLLWMSKELGIDGVIVEQISDGTVSGLGEWDPPGGWKAFNLSLATGQSVHYS
jgi:hypothetical protein